MKILLAIFFTSFLGHVFAAELFIRGSGTLTCADFTESKRTQDTLKMLMIGDYIQGFINGIEIQRAWNLQSEVNFASGDLILSKVEMICRQTPNEQIVVVAAKIAKELIKK
jgi:hypothetical protein